MDISLLVTVGIMFLAAFIGSALRGRAKDRCLQDFDAFHVTLERKDGHIAWGIMHLESTGFELEYRQDVLDEQRHVETSYVLYKDEYPKIQALYRYIDDLDPHNRARRERSCERAFHPGPMLYSLRKIRNFVNTATDSLAEVLNLLLGRTRPVQSQLVLAQGQTQLKGLTKNVLGYVGTSYDPLLERFIGVQAVVEVMIGDDVYEYVGVFKDYTATFIELLDVFFLQEVPLRFDEGRDGDDQPPAADAVREVSRHHVLATLSGRELYVKNEAAYPILVHKLEMAAEERVIDTLVAPGEAYRLILTDVPAQAALTVIVRAIRHLDMLVPREHALLRHRAERYEPSKALSLRNILNEQRARRKRASSQGSRMVDEMRHKAEMLLLSGDQLHPSDKRLCYALCQREQPPEPAPAALPGDAAWDEEALEVAGGQNPHEKTRSP